MSCRVMLSLSPMALAQSNCDANAISMPLMEMMRRPSCIELWYDREIYTPIGVCGASRQQAAGNCSCELDVQPKYAAYTIQIIYTEH